VTAAPAQRSSALARIIQRARTEQPDPTERCDLCNAPVAAVHRHLLDTSRREVMCACQACSLLFSPGGASEGHYRLVTRRRVRLSPVSTQAMGVPVGLAFFVPTADGTVVAHYPSPAGATQWEVDEQAWRDVVAACPVLGGLGADVEALLVNTARGQQQHWLVPIDDCFRLVAIVRREWKGLSGGGTVWREIEGFFGELTERR
jgi:hypothetical protein